MKLTENEVVISLKAFLERTGWEIQEFQLGHNHGHDIRAIKDGRTLIVEAKGAKANISAHNKKREKFDAGQIKDHFGKAIVKMLELKVKNPEALLAIAHPNDIDIRNNIESLIPFLSKLGIKHYWVDEENVDEV